MEQPSSARWQMLFWRGLLGSCHRKLHLGECGPVTQLRSIWGAESIAHSTQKKSIFRVKVACQGNGAGTPPPIERRPPPTTPPDNQLRGGKRAAASHSQKIDFPKQMQTCGCLGRYIFPNNNPFTLAKSKSLSIQAGKSIVEVHKVTVSIICVYTLPLFQR